jgi:hypothetical protein
MNSAFVIIELKGFTGIADSLSLRMEKVGITSERIRGAGIDIIENVFTIINKKIPYEYEKKIGGDTWILKFSNLEDAIKFGYFLFSTFVKYMNQNGIFFIKPVIAINIGEPKFKDDNFLDNTSIRTYRVADKGEPFSLYVLDEAIIQSRHLSWVQLENVKINGLPEDQEVQLINWMEIKNIKNKPQIRDSISLPTLLLDSEIIYSETLNDSVNHIIHQQNSSHSVITFGGPVPFNTQNYKKYLINSIKLIKTKNDCTWTILSYIPLNEPLIGLTWLELCKRLSIQYPEKFTFSAFTLPDGQLRPFSYHIYDDSVVQIGLRSYSPQHGVSIMNAAIMIRNEKIAKRFKNEFLENLRKVGPIDDIKYAEISKSFRGINNQIRQEAFQTVDQLLMG